MKQIEQHRFDKLIKIKLVKETIGHVDDWNFVLVRFGIKAFHHFICLGYLMIRLEARKVSQLVG